MENNLSINRQYAIILIKIQFIYLLVINYIVFTFDLPISLFYVTDIINLLIIILSFKKILYDISHCKYIILYISVFFLLFLSLISMIMNLQSPFLYLWGLRNTYRFFAFFFACAASLRKTDVISICNSFAALLLVNVILCTYQFLTLNQSSDVYVQKFLSDYIGGIFSSYQGANRIMNVYLMFIVVWYLAQYLYNKLTVSKLLLIMAAVFYIAIIAEIKLVFFEFSFTIILAILIVKKGVSKLLYILLGCGLIGIFLSVWSYVDPSNGSFLSSIYSIVQYSSASTYGAGSLNRLTVIPAMGKLVFNGDKLNELFGIGLGNADTSSVSMLSSSIYLKYQSLKYNLFMHGMLYLETGIVGLVSYCTFFIILLWVSIKKGLNGLLENEKAIVLSSAIYSITAFVCIFYNTTLRNETSAYLVFFLLAIPLVWMNNPEEQNYIKPSKVRIIL